MSILFGLMQKKSSSQRCHLTHQQMPTFSQKQLAWKTILNSTVLLWSSQNSTRSWNVYALLAICARFFVVTIDLPSLSGEKWLQKNCSKKKKRETARDFSFGTCRKESFLVCWCEYNSCLCQLIQKIRKGPKMSVPHQKAFWKAHESMINQIFTETFFRKLQMEILR